MLSLSKQKIQPLIVADALQEKGIVIFTAQEFSRLFQVSNRQTRYFLETYTKRALLVRLKKDFYALKANVPNEEIIASVLYRPSYISLEYALSRYGIIPESAYAVTSITTKATATFSVLEKDFVYRKIKKEAYMGYVPEKVAEKIVFMAEPEKALADYLYFISLGRKRLNDRIDCSRLDKKKTLHYGELFRRKKMSTLIEQVFSANITIIK